MSSRMLLLLPVFVLAAWTAEAGAEEPAGDAAEPDSAIAFLGAQDKAVRDILAASPSDSLSAEHRLQVKERINLAFDFVELARLSLGDHWEGRSEAERAEFVETFRSIVEERNFDSFVRYYREGGIEYQGEETAGGRTTVEATAPLRRERVPITYHLHRVDGGWRIYDLAIDGAGTAAGNRRQYARYIERHSFEKLLQRLKSQLEDLSAD